MGETKINEIRRGTRNYLTKWATRVIGNKWEKEHVDIAKNQGNIAAAAFLDGKTYEGGGSGYQRPGEPNLREEKKVSTNKDHRIGMAKSTTLS